MTEPDPQRLAAELQTYRIELEMQNEELHRVQGELESSRSAWEDLFEFAPVGYCTLDAEGTILKLNLAGAGLLGVPRGHLLKKRLALYLAETSRLAFSAFLADVLAGQTGLPCDVAVLREGADPTILHLSGTAEIAGPTCRITMTDVTERRRAEEALRRSEADFRYLFENSVVGKSITLPSGEVRVNEAFARMLGHERKDLEGRYWKDLTHPDDIEESLRHVDLLLSGKEESVHFSKRYLRKDGSVVWAEAWSSLRRDESGSPLYVTTNVVDITERKRAETEIQNLTKGLEQRVSERTQELRRAMEYNRSLIEASIDPLVTIGRDGRILDVNEATVQATGSPRSELVGSDFSEYFTEPDRARAGYERVFSEGTVRDYELHLKRRDALPLPVEYNAT